MVMPRRSLMSYTRPVEGTAAETQRDDGYRAGLPSGRRGGLPHPVSAAVPQACRYPADGGAKPAKGYPTD
jgi:hypothetical protein